MQLQHQQQSAVVTGPAQQAASAQAPGLPKTTSATQLELRQQGDAQSAVAPSSPKKSGKKRIRIQTEKRKEQNRSNQRAFRQRRERYVKDLEISHHHLRHLVTHQGGEIESLKSRLVDLTGGKEGTEPSIPLADPPTMMDVSRYDDGRESTSPSSDQVGSDEGSPRTDAGTGELPSPTFKKELSLPIPMMEQQHVTLASEPASLVQDPFPPHSLPRPINISASDAGGQELPSQFWPLTPASASGATSALPILSPRIMSTSSSTVSSLSSSNLLTPPTPARLLDPMGIHQPFLAVEAAPIASYNTWQPKPPSHVNDFSHWLQHSMQASQYCLPFQDSGDDSFTAKPEQKDDLRSFGYSAFPSADWQTRTNALGLENLFPSLQTSERAFNNTDHLQLLGRPLTPLPNFASPAAEYVDAT